MTRLSIVAKEPAAEAPAQSPARAALAAHLAALAAASERHAAAARRWAELAKGKAAHSAALEALEARQRVEAEALAAWAADLDAAAEARPTIDDAELDRLAKVVRDTRPAHDAAVVAMRSIEQMQIDAARAVHELTARTPALVAEVLIGESADVLVEHERALEQARVTGARLWALRARLTEDNLPGLVARVERGWNVGLTHAQMQSAKASVFAYADALATNPDTKPTE